MCRSRRAVPDDENLHTSRGSGACEIVQADREEPPPTRFVPKLPCDLTFPSRPLTREWDGHPETVKTGYEN